MAFMEFGDIKFLWFGIIIVILLISLYFFKIKNYKYHTKKISTSPVLNKVVKKRSRKDKIMSIMLLISLFSLFIALADPMMRLKNEKEGVNLILTMDSSGSMTAKDFQPNRISSSKSSAKAFVRQLDLKDNVGVVGFSDTTRIVSFMTNDKEKVIEKISSIKADGGTAIGDGLAMSVDMVTSIPNKKKLVILLSDGEQTTGQISIPDAILYAKAEEVVVYTIGIGSEDPVSLGRDFWGRQQFARLDEESLKLIASETGGQYFRATDSVKLNEIYDSLPEIIKKEKELQSVKDWFIWLSILLLSGTFITKYWKRISVW